MKKTGKLLSLLLAVLMLTAMMPVSALAAALPFTDVPQDAWYYPVVKEAYEKGITNGVTRTTFEPNATVTREQMATLVERFMEVRFHVALKDAEHPAAAFSDADQVSDWAKDAVEAMRVAGVLQGDAQNYVNPKAHTTRAEAAAVILRLADATERVSFVPEETAWIRIMSSTTLKDIKDPKTVQDMIRYLDNMPIDSESILPGGTDAGYVLQFYDQNDQPLMNILFSNHAVVVNHSMLQTVLPYFLPWTLMN